MFLQAGKHFSLAHTGQPCLDLSHGHWVSTRGGVFGCWTNVNSSQHKCLVNVVKALTARSRWNSVFTHPWIPAEVGDFIGCLARLCHGKSRQQGELKMFSLLCEQDIDVCIIWKSWRSREKPESQSWAMTQNRKRDNKISVFPVWRTLLKEKLWNVGYLWVDEECVVFLLAEHYQYPGARQPTISPPLLVGRSCCSWGRKLEWTVMTAQQGPLYVFPQFKHRHKPKGCDSLSDALLKKEKNIEIKWTIWKILCPLQR